MRAVVTGGTGTARGDPRRARGGQDGHRRAAIDAALPPEPGTDPEACQDSRNDPTDTDAWFVAYAPAGAGRPKVAVGVLLVGAGAGGQSAAPAARSVRAGRAARRAPRCDAPGPRRPGPRLATCCVFVAGFCVIFERQRARSGGPRP